LMVLCLVSAGLQDSGSAVEFNELDTPIEQIDEAAAPVDAPTEAPQEVPAP